MIRILLLLVSSTAQEVPAPKLLDTNMRLQTHGGWGNTHEKTHGVNSALRQRHGGTGSVNCFYLMGGKFVKFREPKPYKISHVAPRVRMRGKTYQLYLVSQLRYWNNEPLYLFDEWISYTNGAVDAWHRGVTDYHSTVTFALEFAHYTATLVEILPEYDERQELARFWIWNAKRLDVVVNNAKKTGRLYRAGNDAWQAEMHAAMKRIAKLAQE